MLSHFLIQKTSNKFPSITKVPGVCGGEACIVNTRIPIWVLVEARELGYSNADLLASYPQISESSLADAWIYAESHIDEILSAIQRNQSA
jgi:uncharacterized protein (DUF433 family)